MSNRKIIEGFSCVKMQREIREKISEKIATDSDAFFKSLKEKYKHLHESKSQS